MDGYRSWVLGLGTLRELLGKHIAAVVGCWAGQKHNDDDTTEESDATEGLPGPVTPSCNTDSHGGYSFVADAFVIPVLAVVCLEASLLSPTW